jgi:hypothetical protein
MTWKSIVRGCMLSMCLLAVTAGPAMAKKWSVSSTPGIPKEIGRGVSCTSSTSCIGISQTYGTAGYGAGAGLAYTWNGTAWQKPFAFKRPAESTKATLGAIACTSSTECTAVGGYTRGTEDLTLAERTTNGKEWKIQTTTSPTTSSGFSSISCASSTACTAVGSTGSGPLAESWNGTAWEAHTVPVPSGGSEGYAAGVSCHSSTECVLVGEYHAAAGRTALVDRWNGSAWKSESPPAPEGAKETILSGVSCTSASACTAAGRYNTATRRLVLVERWNGKEWSVQKAVDPGGEKVLSELSGVSCAAATECTAVGTRTNETTNFPETLAEAWNGTEWTVETTPNPESTNELQGVSCNSNTACMSVGPAGAKQAYHLSGTTWSTTSIPAPKASGSSISCPSSTSCIATANTEWAGFAYVWNGTSWGVLMPESPAGTPNAALSGVSCTSSTECTGVGDYTTQAGETRTWATRMTSEDRWTTQTTPNPTTQSRLNAVSCPSATACTAVGSKGALSASEPLAEAWNGKEWSTQTVPMPTEGKIGHLSGVSCTSTGGECTAVGSYVSSSGVTTALAERWNGKAWTVEALPLPTGGEEASLHSVSCGASGECMAVGSYTSTTGHFALAEYWGTKKWTAGEAVNPTGATASEMLGVSCMTGPYCAGVGDYSNSKGEELTLAEWSFVTKWTLETMPNPSTASRMESDACTVSTETCMAFGSDVLNESVLAERYS